MTLEILKSKILRAEVTNTEVDYEGSLAIDLSIMKLVGLRPYEKILVGNISNGNRFETYAIAAPEGSCIFSLNGAAGLLGKVGDRLVIMSFCHLSEQEYETHKPKSVCLTNKNSKIVKSLNIQE